MKNKQKNHRNQQPHQNRQNQQPRPHDIAAMLADISISEGVTIPVPRDEYDELLYCSALVDILRRLHKNDNDYAMKDLLENIFDDEEKEDK